MPWNNANLFKYIYILYFFSVLRLEYAQIRALLSSLNVFINPDFIEEKNIIRHRNLLFTIYVSISTIRVYLKNSWTFWENTLYFTWKIIDAHMSAKLWLSGVQCHCFWLRESSLPMKNILIFFFKFYSINLFKKCNNLIEILKWNVINSTN